MDLLKKIREEKNPASIFQEIVGTALLNNLCTSLSRRNLADAKQKKTFNYMRKCFTTGTPFSLRYIFMDLSTANNLIQSTNTG